MGPDVHATFTFENEEFYVFWEDPRTKEVFGGVVVLSRCFLYFLWV